VQQVSRLVHFYYTLRP